MFMLKRYLCPYNFSAQKKASQSFFFFNFNLKLGLHLLVNIDFYYLFVIASHVKWKTQF